MHHITDIVEQANAFQLVYLIASLEIQISCEVVCFNILPPRRDYFQPASVFIRLRCCDDLPILNGEDFRHFGEPTTAMRPQNAEVGPITGKP